MAFLNHLESITIDVTKAEYCIKSKLYYIIWNEP